MRKSVLYKLYTATLLVIALSGTTLTVPLLAQPGQNQQAPDREGNVKYEYARMITLESVVPGGAGRSRMFVITPDGKKQEAELSNYYSLTGINFSNIYQNEEKKTTMLNEMAKSGWEVYWVETGSQEGIYTTKYLLRRPIK